MELRTDSAVAVDPAAHQLALGSGRDLKYGKLLIATGGRNRRLQVPGAELPGIHYLRTVAECDAIKHGSPWRDGVRWWWAWGSSAARWRPP